MSYIDDEELKIGSGNDEEDEEEEDEEKEYIDEPLEDDDLVDGEDNPLSSEFKGLDTDETE